jgi:hypothetical protein
MFRAREYSSHPVCDKCGSMEVSFKYQSESDILHVTCVTCGRQFLMHCIGEEDLTAKIKKSYGGIAKAILSNIEGYLEEMGED